MSDRVRNGALAGALVLILVLVGFLLRSRETDSGTASPVPSPTATDSPSPTASAPSGPVVFLGDSLAEGKTASSPSKRWTAIVADGLGLEEVNLGHAGTGYLRDDPEGSCGEGGCPSFAESVKEVVAAEPSTVIVTGGGNDLNLPDKEVSAAVTSTLDQLTKALPDATIYVVNPWWDLRPEPAGLAPLTQVVATAATKAEATYLDTQQPLVDEPALMVGNGRDPNDAGHAALAKAVLDAVEVSTNG